MTLFLATFIPGVVLALLGAILCWNGTPVIRGAKALPRSSGATWVFFGAGAAWFLWRLSQLTEADLIFLKPRRS